jgi:hypothetical protein
MNLKNFKGFYISILSLFLCFTVSGQNVPLGIFYQAVARDNSGRELASRDIDIKFSIISGNPLGTVVYQELHDKVTTSKFGIFSLILGRGTVTGGTFGDLSEIQWGQALHYLKVEVKFDNDFIDMGTMQFLSVPYALYAQKSLEPGPAGPKGDAGPKGESGDPASDNQTLSFDQSNITISNGNSVPLTSLLQNLTITTKPEGNYLGISRGNSVLLSSAEADGDPVNEIQDLVINSDVLKITKNASATSWSLTKYLQGLTWNPATRRLGITDNASSIDLTELKDDADASPTNELQSLSYNSSTNTLSISGGNSAVLGSMVAFRAQKTIASSAPMPLSNVDFIANQVEYNDGSGLNAGTGEFTAPGTGIFTFDVKYIDPNDGGAGRKLMMFKNGNLYEYLENAIAANTTIFRTLTIKLNSGDKIKVVIYTGTATGIGTGSFSGYKVY